MCGVSQEARAPPSSLVQPAPTISNTVEEHNCFRILIATDNHIGYAEKDPIRGQDALNTFREILEIARDQDVDFILLAGDLFHENRPSRACLHQTMALLREYTLGDKPISFELLSDPMDGATPGFSFPAVNYEDPNLNVAIPVFSIHGNHDDPQGTGPEGALCALDMLSVSGLLNYFGKSDLPADDVVEDDDKGIHIKPILLRKGSTHLGLYGVGNVRDQRMHYELRSNRVKMFMPEGGDIPEDDWFNLLLVHQNRVKHGPQNYVPETMFDDSIKLVIWGHEHDCRIEPEEVEGKPYAISQPGSSVATSLAPGEAMQKQVGILSIQGSEYQLATFDLKTVRPFQLDELVLEEEAALPDNKINLDDKDSISTYLRERVEELIAKARTKWAEEHDGSTKDMMLPLIRLKVETSAAKEMTNPVRFGQDYMGRVANPRDILQYYRKKKTERKAANKPDMPDREEEEWIDDPSDPMSSSDASKIRMASLVKQYLQAQNLSALDQDGMETAVMRFVDKDDKDAIKDFVRHSLTAVDKGSKKYEGPLEDEEDIDEYIAQAKDDGAKAGAEAVEGTNKSKKGNGKAKKQDSDVDGLVDEDSMMESEEDVKPKRGRGKAAAAPKKAAPKGNGRQPLFTPASDNGSDDDDVQILSDSPEPKKKAPARGGAAKRGTARGTTTRGGRTTKAAAASSSRQTQLSFSRGAKKSNLVDSDSD